MKDEKLLQVDEDGLPIGFAKWANKKLPNDIGSMTIAYCEDAWRAALQPTNSAQPVTVPDGVKKALSDAVAAIYFTDSSDYLSALFAVVKALSPETLELLIANDKAAYEATRLPDAPKGV